MLKCFPNGIARHTTAVVPADREDLVSNSQCFANVSPICDSQYLDIVLTKKTITTSAFNHIRELVNHKLLKRFQKVQKDVSINPSSTEDESN